MLSTEFLDQISVFETLRAYRGKIFCAEEHLARLEDSCEGIRKPLPVGKGELKHWMTATLRESTFPDAMMRLSVHWKNDLEGIFLLIIREFHAYPRQWYEKGVSLSTAVAKRWTLRAQDPQIKSSMYMSGVMAMLDERSTAPHEFIFLNETGYVAEGSVSNLFIVCPALDKPVSIPHVKGGVKSKRLLTPAVSSGILRGVTRGIIIDLAKKIGLEVAETFFSRHDVYGAEECFMANTSSEVLPVVLVDGHEIGKGKPGRITQVLAQDLKKYIQGTLKK